MKALLALLCFAAAVAAAPIPTRQPLTHAPSPAVAVDPWPQLPSADLCRRNYHAAQEDSRRLAERLEQIGGPRQGRQVQAGAFLAWVEGPRLGGGWRVQQLEMALAQSQRLEAIWRAAWGVRDPDRVETPWASRFTREEWLEELCERVGAPAALAGRLPLPLSCR